MGQRIVRIGGASGFWGDSSLGAPQLVRSGQVDYLVFDYLAELTMSILAAQRAKHPEAGFALDFVTVTMRSILKEVVERGIRVVSNAGGINPAACARALSTVAAEQGISVRIAVVEGDDVSALLPELRARNVRDVQSGRAMPATVLSANAYLGALPIKAALDGGAQIVLTGRCVDSAVTLGSLMHAFGWEADAYELLAQGSLAGHIIECGCQATGGLFTDWESVPDWANIGYPVLECGPDGTFVCTKPEGTGGLVTPAVIAEQMLYEIGDPARYVLPDVVCDFTHVEARQVGTDRVEVRGARGRPPTSTYKVSGTYTEGYKCAAELTVIGFDAVRKARRTGEALLERTRAMFAGLGFSDYTETSLEILGSESAYGANARALGTREAIMRLAVRHADRRALELFAREIAAPGTSFAPGTTGLDGRPSVSPAIKSFAFLLDKGTVSPRITLGDRQCGVEIPPGRPESESMPAADGVGSASAAEVGLDAIELPLMAVAHGRSGDKGDTSNIGIVARSRALLPYLRSQLTEERVAAFLGHLVKGKVTRYELPGIGAFNFVCEQALGGGGMASLRHDALGKGMAQILLSMPVRVPRELTRACDPSEDAIEPE